MIDTGSHVIDTGSHVTDTWDYLMDKAKLTGLEIKFWDHR